MQQFWESKRRSITKFSGIKTLDAGNNSKIKRQVKLFIAEARDLLSSLSEEYGTGDEIYQHLSDFSQQIEDIATRLNTEPASELREEFTKAIDTLSLIAL